LQDRPDLLFPADVFRAPFFTLSLMFPVAASGQKVLPVLNHLITDKQFVAGSAAQVVDLNGNFGMEPIDAQVVRFTAQYGPPGSPITTTMDMALFSNRTPVSRTNFLNYVTGGRYLNSFIHRSAPGFVIQGGGFRFTTSVSVVPTYAPIVNEFGISNTLGTVSMAKLGGDPNSATSQWFVSSGANSDNLDFQNGGFTVFARVTKSTLQTALSYNDPAQFPIWNAGGAFDNLPLHSSFPNTRDIEAHDLIRFSSVALAPLPAGEAGESTQLAFSVVSNSNPAVATATISGQGVLTIRPMAGGLGSTVFLIRATDSVGNRVDDSFSVSQVREPFSAWRTRVFSAADATNDLVSGPLADPDHDGLTNLELFAHGLTPGQHRNPVSIQFANSARPAFTLPKRNDIDGLSVTIEGSSDLGITDSWKTTPHEQVAKTTEGNIDTITIQPTEAGTLPMFYRLKFQLSNP
jgi:cyclophilin family peptidyl-prolyl cis-trans isomerase